MIEMANRKLMWFEKVKSFANGPILCMNWTKRFKTIRRMIFDTLFGKKKPQNNKQKLSTHSHFYMFGTNENLIPTWSNGYRNNMLRISIATINCSDAGCWYWNWFSFCSPCNSSKKNELNQKKKLYAFEMQHF